jgi:elongation factor Ts
VPQAHAFGEGAEVLSQPFVAQPDKTIQEALTEKIAKIGENMAVRRYARFDVAGAGRTEVYIHMGGRIGVLVEATAVDAAQADKAEFKAILRDVALQVAAARPEFVSREEVPAEVVERESAIYKAQAANEGKPAPVQEKIAQGRLEKFYKDICLLEQPFVKDPDKNVQAVLKEAGTAVGGPIQIRRFARFERGEGLAKREDNFAAEVLGQVNQ